MASKEFKWFASQLDKDRYSRYTCSDNGKIWLEVDSATNSGLRPLPNVWVGVTVENQETAKKRIPLLLQIPAKKRWLSMEPLLDYVDLGEDDMIITFLEHCLHTKYYDPYRHLGSWEDFNFFKVIDWIVVGGESGGNARPCEIDWIESIVDQCKEEKVPVWVKQMGSNSTCYEEPCPGPPGDRQRAKLENIPPWLQVREFPC